MALNENYMQMHLKIFYASFWLVSWTQNLFISYSLLDTPLEHISEMNLNLA